METLLKLNDQLMNAPAGVITALFAIAFGYILKTSAFFPNNRIPLVIVIFTSIVFPILELCADAMNSKPDFLLKIPFNVIAGFIIGCAAWLFHAQLLKRFVDPKFFNDDGSTKFLKRDQSTNDPAPKP